MYIQCHLLPNCQATDRYIPSQQKGVTHLLQHTTRAVLHTHTHTQQCCAQKLNQAHTATALQRLLVGQFITTTHNLPRTPLLVSGTQGRAATVHTLYKGRRACRPTCAHITVCPLNAPPPARGLCESPGSSWCTDTQSLPSCRSRQLCTTAQ